MPWSNYAGGIFNYAAGLNSHKTHSASRSSANLKLILSLAILSGDVSNEEK
jgi:hypothetical protein